MSAEHAHHHPNYVKVWGILLVLLVISILGPELEIQIVTLVTAFGIAVVKAYLVARNFMHINIARRYVTYLMATCLVFMLLFFAGVSPDVMEEDGDNWRKDPETWFYSPSVGHGEAHGAGHGGGGH